MKLSKKTILIIAIVVAVVAYLVWRKRQNSDDIEAPASTSTSMSVKSILASIGADSTVKSYVNSVVTSIANNAEWKQKIINQANAEGITYEQAAVLNALWLMYDKNKLDWASFDKLTSKVRDL